VQQWSSEDDTLRDAIVLKKVKEIRVDMPRIGTHKLWEMLPRELAEHKITIGRDKLFDLLEEYGMLVRRRKRKKAITTDSNHPFRRYANLTRELQPVRPNQLWVSDITYIRLVDEFCYLSLVTDAYSRKIVGYCLYPTLQKEGPVAALKMGLAGLPVNFDGLIHHSDRGKQYCCDAYVSMLTERKALISMTEKGDPYENALAERVNRTMKEEFLLDRGFNCFEQAQAAVSKAVNIYNTLRPHDSCNRMTPEAAHQQYGLLPKRWKKRKTKQQPPEENPQPVGDILPSD
jgi:transposase InsO family protein